MVDTLVETHIRRTLLKKFVPMPQTYWDNLTSLGDIFDSVKKRSAAAGQSDECPYRQIQAKVILEDWVGLRACMTEWLPLADPHLLRYC